MVKYERRLAGGTMEKLLYTLISIAGVALHGLQIPLTHG
jgi:hypothetical protein